MNKLFSLIFLIFLVICCRNKEKFSNFQQKLYPESKIVQLNTNNGYVLNQVSNDTIKKLINSYGDTIKTGTELPIKGKIINSDSILLPKKNSIISKKNVKIRSHFLENKTQINLTKFENSKIKLNKTKFGHGNQKFSLISCEGDTIPTGIPVKYVKQFKQNPQKLFQCT